MAPFPSDAAVTNPPPAVIPKVGLAVVLCGRRMSPRGASTIAMFRSEGGEVECVEVVGEGGASANDGAGTAKDEEGAREDAPDRCAESGSGNWGGVSSYSSSFSSLSPTRRSFEAKSPAFEEAPLPSPSEAFGVVDHPGIEGRAERSWSQLGNEISIAGRWPNEARVNVPKT